MIFPAFSVSEKIEMPEADMNEIIKAMQDTPPQDVGGHTIKKGVQINRYEKVINKDKSCKANEIDTGFILLYRAQLMRKSNI